MNFTLFACSHISINIFPCHFSISDIILPTPLILFYLDY